jgi:hypothetical protein
MIEESTGLRATDLIGTWALRTWESVDEEGAIVLPFGPDPIGYVVYTADGHMITAISESGRIPIGGDPFAGPSEGRLAAFASFIAYAGTFRVEGEDVIHSVEMSLLPDWVGGEQLRHVKLSPNRSRLTLSTEPLTTAGRIGRHRLTWERVEA